MIKALFWVTLGAVGALQSEKWFGDMKKRLNAHAVTDALLDRVNRRLESERGASRY
jgi:hypothetical protein